MSEDGILVVDKTLGKTSRSTTNFISRLLKTKKAGHLGTLDPNATGVLPIALGKATKIIRFIEKENKIYRGTIKLGITTDSQDSVGNVIQEKDPSFLKETEIKEALLSFKGETEQMPPMFSALKKDGVPLYKLARIGEDVKREPRKITVYEIEVESIEMPFVTIKAMVSPGTYLRTIAHDLGEKTGVGAHLCSLVRLANGPFKIEDAVSISDLDFEKAKKALVPLKDCLPQFQEVTLDTEQAEMVLDGMSIPANENVNEGQRCRLVHDGQLISIALAVNIDGEASFKPIKVFHP